MTLDDETLSALGYGDPWADVLGASHCAAAEWRERMRRERAECRAAGEIHPSDRPGRYVPRSSLPPEQRARLLALDERKRRRRGAKPRVAAPPDANRERCRRWRERLGPEAVREKNRRYQRERRARLRAA